MSASTLAFAGPDRRRHARFRTPPMYHAVAVRPLDSSEASHDGHAYDLSEGGAQIELDEALAVGAEVALCLHLPAGYESGPGRSIVVLGRVIWVEEDETPGPARIAIAFREFAREVDAARLRRYLNQGQLRLAA